MTPPDEEPIPHLSCNVCVAPLSSDNYPVQSLVCGHSICITCVSKATTTATAATNTTDSRRKPSSAGAGRTTPDYQYLKCPMCAEAKAFHPALCKPNLMALGAMELIKQCTEIIQEKTASRNSIRTMARSSCNVKDNSSSAKPSSNTIVTLMDNPQTKTATAGDNVLMNKEEQRTAFCPAAKRTIGNTVSFQGNPCSTTTTTSSAGSECSEESLEQASPAGDSHPIQSRAGGGAAAERMVWVKFGKGTHLAVLLETKKDTAIVRWESNKRKEKVSLDRIEEMDDGNNNPRMSRPKRRRRSVATFSSQVFPAYYTKKTTTTKRRKSHA